MYFEKGKRSKVFFIMLTSLFIQSAYSANPPADPAKPAQAVQPAQPAQAAHPVRLAQAAQPAKPARAAQPAKPAQAVQPVQLAQAAQPAQLPQAGQPAQPAQAAQPAQPTQAVQSAQPAQPAHAANHVHQTSKVHQVSHTHHVASSIQVTKAAPVGQPIPTAQTAHRAYPNYRANWFSELKPLLSQYVITLSGFQGWESTNAKQTIFLTPEIVKAYVSNPSTQAFGTGELFVGVYQPINQTFEWQLGLALGATGNTRITGTIWDDANPKFNNYNYSYMVRSTHLSMKGKILADIGMAIIPWFSGSIGVGFNQSHDFTSTPTFFQALPTPGFSSYTTVAFTYAFGFGAQLPITDNWQIGVGYEFSDWGKSQLSRAPGQTQGSGPVLYQLYASSVLLNLSYLA